MRRASLDGLAGVHGQAPGQLLDLVDRHGVPAAQGLGHDGEEGDVGGPAPVPGARHLPVVGHGHGVPRGGGGAGPGGGLEGVDDGHIQGGVPAAAPARDEEVGRPPLGAGDEGAALLDGGEARLDGHVEEAVAEQVVSPGAFASCAAAETVVGQGPFWVAFQLQNGGH